MVMVSGRGAGGLPAPVDAARQNLAVPADRQAHLAGGDGPLGAVAQLAEKVRDDGRGEPGRVGVDEEEEGRLREERAAFRQELPELVLEAPGLPRAAASEGGRVHDDRVVAA